MLMLVHPSQILYILHFKLCLPYTGHGSYNRSILQSNVEQDRQNIAAARIHR